MTAETRFQATFDELVDALEARVDETVGIHMRRMREHYPEEAIGDPVIHERIREFSAASMLVEYEALRAGALPEAAPPLDASAARELAQLGIPVEWVLTGFRVGHRCHWEAWMDLVERRIEDVEARRSLLDRASRFFFDYVDRLSALLTEEYERERERVHRTRGGQRTVLVHQLLNGTEHDSDSVGWPLEHHHLGLLGWGEGGDRALQELGATLGRPLLVVESGVDGARFGWLSGAARLNAAEQRTISEFRPSQGRVAIGLDAPGAEGFTLTNRQARRASWVAWSTDEPVTRFSDVALEGLAIEDLESARSFTTEELRGFGDESTRSERLRETLRAYFSADHNAAAAAAVLGVHQQTVANRIKAVEELLGSTVGARRAELELALRLHRCLANPPALPVELSIGSFHSSAPRG